MDFESTLEKSLSWRGKDCGRRELKTKSHFLCSRTYEQLDETVPRCSVDFRLRKKHFSSQIQSVHLHSDSPFFWGAPTHEGNPGSHKVGILGS